MINDQIQTWQRSADHYAKLAGEHTDASSQLACLILANYCVHQWSGDHGGPSQEMVQLAEKILSISARAATSAPPAQNEQDLRQRILESLIIYWNGTQQYLRFCPIDMPPFRHGLSLNVKLGDDLQRDREIARHIHDLVAELDAARAEVERLTRSQATATAGEPRGETS